MRLLRTLHRLGRHPRLLVLIAVSACVVGVAIPYKIGFPPRLTSRQHEIGIASASALIDTPKSQIADFGTNTGGDVTTLAAQASLLGTVMSGTAVKDEIASLARVPVGKLVVNPPPSAGTPTSPAPPPASPVQRSPRADVINVSIVQGGQLPIIEVDTHATKPAIAARLANASIQAITTDVESTAGADRVPTAYRLVIRPLGPAVANRSTVGPGPGLGVIGGIGAFLLGCALILGVPALRSAWREAGEMDEVDRLSVGPSPPRPLPRSANREFEPSRALESGVDATPELEARTGSSEAEDILESRL